ncbi:MAG: biopolymer transporter ExbD [Halofilum sp. (in: g-proteobacteria)]|nr:biopolymer transporter ExbD [Halofilum sp. (in: g-proteobacteria)]
MVFILLIFFMVSTTFVKDMDLDIDRPTAKSADQASAEAIRALHRFQRRYLSGR